jgi:hypothetical protein
MRKQVDMELESAALHRRAKEAGSEEGTRQLCEQIQAESLYRDEEPCKTLLAVVPAPTAEAGPAMADAGAGQQKVRDSRPSKLSDREIQRIIRKNRPSVVRCIDKAFSGGSHWTGTVRASVRITIAESGRVSRAKLIQAGTHDSTFFRNCVENTVRAWTFPESGRTSTTEFTFSKRVGGELFPDG